MLFLCVKILHKKIKRLEISLITSFILLLTQKMGAQNQSARSIETQLETLPFGLYYLSQIDSQVNVAIFCGAKSVGCYH